MTTTWTIRSTSPTCLKHFLGYSVPASGKDRTPANIPWNALMEYHLPAFREALDAGAHSVMVNSGIIDNDRCTPAAEF